MRFIFRSIRYFALFFYTALAAASCALSMWFEAAFFVFVFLLVYFAGKKFDPRVP